MGAGAAVDAVPHIGAEADLRHHRPGRRALPGDPAGSLGHGPRGGQCHSAEFSGPGVTWAAAFGRPLLGSLSGVLQAGKRTTSTTAVFWGVPVHVSEGQFLEDFSPPVFP